MANHTLPLPLEFHNGEEPLAIEIPLTKGKVAVVDAIDSDLATVKWTAQHSSNGNYYASRRIRDNVLLLLHRVILERKLNRKLMPGECCDHIDMDRMNNRRDNLRLSSKSTNAANTGLPKHNTSGYKGVSKIKGTEKWYAYIRINGKTKNLGHYDTPEEAYDAYCTAAKQVFGEFARLE